MSINLEFLIKKQKFLLLDKKSVIFTKAHNIIIVGSGEMPLLSKALKTESYSKSRKAVRYVVFMFVILSFFLSF